MLKKLIHSYRLLPALLRPAYSEVHANPVCPHCGVRMELRIPTRGALQGMPFYVCPNYKRCGALMRLRPARR
jgi:hypothetical protein